MTEPGVLVLCECGHGEQRHRKRGSEIWCYRPDLPKPACDCRDWRPAVKLTGYGKSSWGHLWRVGAKDGKTALERVLAMANERGAEVEWL